MNRFARLATRLLAAPRAVVWIAAGHEATEAAEAWPPGVADEDMIAFCRRTAREGRPWAGRSSGAGVVCFAGVPLAGPDGALLGVLAVADTGVRRWSEDDLENLTDLAAACSAQVRLRERSRTAQRGQQEAEAAAGLAVVEANRMEVLLSRAELLLRAAEDLGNTSGLVQVRTRVGDLVSGDLKPSYVGLVLVGEDGLLHRLPSPGGGGAWSDASEVFELGSAWPSARAVREGRMVVVDAREALAAGYGPEAAAAFDARGLRTVVCAPLLGVRGTLGALVLGWETPYTVDVAEQAVLTALAGYTARAVERALYLDERISVAHQLQQSMLTDLPEAPGLEIAALYRPAAHEHMVGGDWYDMYPLAPTDRGGGSWAVTVGDIIGHDLAAATVMGQVRSMLRQADHDQPGHAPHHALEALDTACHTIGVPAGGTLIHAHLTPRPRGHWHFAWTNAGHPPPLLARPGHGAESLPGNDILLHPALPPTPRTTHTRLLPPGSTLLLYTDGLIEHRHQDLDRAIDHAARHLDAADPHTPLQHVLHDLTNAVGPRHPEDDTVTLAIRTAPPTAE
ncbi:SpoIIE family protein phosphatase [Streptomyces sp. NPDC059851]|uniref:SpoIIE family protein phosphatase n=1 Tax=Streptomyces sp. NPDC059851 TaxID=3346971 RepID=UPI00364692C5